MDAVAQGLVVVGCGLNLPGRIDIVGCNSRLSLVVRLGATQGGERAGLTSHPEVCVDEGAVWGLTRIREVQGCGLNCCSD